MTGTNWPFASSQCGIRRPAPRPSTSVCSGSGMGVAQIRPNVAKLGTVATDPPVAREFHEFVVAHDQFFQRLFISGAQNGNEHAVLGLDGEAHVNGTGMDNLIADE